MALQDTSLVWKVLVVVQVTGLILSLTGFSSPNQIQVQNHPKYHIGLWQACIKGCKSVEHYLDILGWDETWVEVSKGMMGVAMGAELLVIVLSLLAIAMTLTKLIGFITAGTSFLSAVIGLIGITVFQVESKKLMKRLTYGFTVESAWSFYLFLTSQLLYVLCGLGHIFDSRQRSR